MVVKIITWSITDKLVLLVAVNCKSKQRNVYFFPTFLFSFDFNIYKRQPKNQVASN